MNENEFDAWNVKKKKLDQQRNYLHPKEREIWWCSVGKNVGSEIYGKGNNFARPVLVINADEDRNFVGIPLSSILRSRKYSSIIRSEDGNLHSALVYQMKNFDNKRLINLFSSVSKEEYLKVKDVFKKIFKT